MTDSAWRSTEGYKASGKARTAWREFVAGKTVERAWEDGDWQIIQFTDGTKLEFVITSFFHMVESKKQ